MGTPRAYHGSPSNRMRPTVMPPSGRRSASRCKKPRRLSSLKTLKVWRCRQHCRWRPPWFEPGVEGRRTRCDNGGMMESCAGHSAFRCCGYPAEVAIGKKKTDQKYDGKRNKTLEYWVVEHHDCSYRVGSETDDVSSFESADHRSL